MVIGNKNIGDDSSVFIIAELSANHGGALEKGKACHIQFFAGRGKSSI